jgi:cytochrome P450
VALGPIRLVTEDITLPGNKMIPKGSWCMVHFYSLFRNHTVFENPDSFCPSRWENPSEESLRAVVPFALGRRNCQGQALAKTELNTAVARLCSSYSFDVVEEGAPDFIITLKPKGSKLAVKRLD